MDEYLPSRASQLPRVPEPALTDLVPARPIRRERGPVFAVLVVMIALVGALAGFVAAFSGGTGANAAVLIRSAAAATANAGSAQVHGTVTVSEVGNTVTAVSFSGAQDFASKTAELTMHSTVVDLRMVLADGVVYESVPIVALPHGAHWVSITPADSGSGTRDFSGLGTSDPTSGLQFLDGVAGSPHLVGREELDGEPVTHYSFTIDLASLLSRVARSSDRLGAGNLGDSLRRIPNELGLSSVPGDAWLDGAGRVRRFRYELAIGVGSFRVSAIGDLYFDHFGDEVSISVPEASDVVPFSQLPDFFQRLQAALAAKARPSA